jgi:transposase InsO family protein
LPQSPQRPILGVIDHGTRTLLTLQDLRARTIIALLRALFDLIEKFGRPQFLRTDNEPAFASPRFSVALWLVGVRHQRTEPHSPWQNGRIERFFWTLKERLLLWWEAVGVPHDIQPDLNVLRTWYNHVRPHQGLAGLTPAVAWCPSIAERPIRFFSAWNQILTGYGRPT